MRQSFDGSDVALVIFTTRTHSTRGLMRTVSLTYTIKPGTRALVEIVGQPSMWMGRRYAPPGVLSITSVIESGPAMRKRNPWNI